MATTVKVVARPAGIRRQTYLIAIAEGLWTTFRHFAKNWPGNLLGRRAKTDIATVSYPEEKKPYPERHRGLHRLMKREDGEVRCVACMMCPTVCPAHCITIVPEEAPDGRIEKRPRIFEIDELRCVVCGLCVEACPCDAIRMDTKLHAPPTLRRGDAILDKQALLARGEQSTATQGGVGPFWREKVEA
jgi:NADH-quinone oxidoreductase subunit I